MCGIAGVYNFKGTPISDKAIYAMTDAMAHRGPDASGHYCDDHVLLGHRRLSIIDLSPAGRQPFTSSNGRYKVVFNGEVYNFRSVRATIRDHEFISSGDTEVLVEGWSRWGVELIPKLKGMFSFAVWDTWEKELTICRDRLGVKPLYYYLDDDKFVFASEIRAVMAAGGIKRKLSEDGLISYLSYQSITGPQTIYKDVMELEAGHCMHIKDDRIQIRKYWDIMKNDGCYDGEDSVKKNILKLLQNAVEQRLVSDVPVGAFLSGGIDSSAVVALMSQMSSTPPETFNLSFAEKEYDESAYAEIISKKFNTRHHKVMLRPEAMIENLFPALKAMDTPSADGINSYVVSKAIRDAGITVALSGIGGDELFAGYPFFKQYKTLQRFSGIWNLTAGMRKIISKGIFTTNSKSGRMVQLLQSESCSIQDVYPVFRRILSEQQLNVLLSEQIHCADVMKHKLSNLAGLSGLPDYSQVSVAEYMGYTQHTLLKDTDQMSMAVSLEVREPFFDHELVEYVLQIPDHIKHPTYPKKLLVEALGDLLPRDIVHRKKQGFVFPWAQWMRNELKSFCAANIHSISERGFINGEKLLNEWQKFLRGDKSVRWAEIWIFVILEQWIQNNGAE